MGSFPGHQRAFLLAAYGQFGLAIDKAVPSAFDAFEPQVRVLLAQFPQMPATVLAERVGWTGSPSWFRKRVAVLRPELAPKDPADRLQYSPGDQVQCDLWFPTR